MEEFANTLMKQNQEFLKECLRDIIENHSQPSKRTLELIDDLKKQLQRLETQQEKNDKEYKDIVQKHNDAYEKHMIEIFMKLNEISQRLVNVYTKDQVDVKLEKNDEKYASKKTEGWIDKVGWEVVKTVLLALLGFVVYAKVG